jgi:tripartite-type tricarboxylate transporter receptor subunit TctC
MPEVQAKLKALGGEAGSLTPEQFSQMNRQEYERLGALIKQANIKLE